MEKKEYFYIITVQCTLNMVNMVITDSGILTDERNFTKRELYKEIHCILEKKYIFLKYNEHSILFYHLTEN